VDLQRQVLPSHGVEKIEADGTLGPESREGLLAQELHRQVFREVHGRRLDANVAKAQVDTVLLGHAIKAPRVVVGPVRQSAHPPHPLATPYAGIEVRNEPKRGMGEVTQTRAEGLPRHHMRRACGVRVEIEVDAAIQRRLMSVRNTPLHEVASLVLTEDVLAPIVLFVVRHAGTISALDLPTRHVGIDEKVTGADKRRSDTIDEHPACLRRNLGLRLGEKRRVDEVGHGAVVHVAAHAICREISCHETGELVARIEYARRVDGQVGLPHALDLGQHLHVANTGVAVDHKHTPTSHGHGPHDRSPYPSPTFEGLLIEAFDACLGEAVVVWLEVRICHKLNLP